LWEGFAKCTLEWELSGAYLHQHRLRGGQLRKVKE
jgi:hypothetical protein